MTTAVAPSGKAPPVVILAICPGSSVVADPSDDAAAIDTAVTGYCPGPSVSVKNIPRNDISIRAHQDRHLN
jgi:hypothetical protein